jgi:hypothetical protein
MPSCVGVGNAIQVLIYAYADFMCRGLRRAAPALGAIRCYENAGFKSVGLMRRYERDMGGDGWHDALLMELLAGEEHQSAVARSSCRQGG